MGRMSSVHDSIQKTFITERVETIFVYTAWLIAKVIVVSFNGNEISTRVAAVSKTTASPVTPTSAIPSAASEQSTSDQGLSSGAKAGTGVGIGLGVCVFALLGLFLHRSWKRKTPRDESTVGWQMPELSNQPIKVKELSGDAVGAKELRHDAMKAQELPSLQSLVDEHQTVS